MIPLASTTITITRVTQPDDGYADPVEVVITTNVRAVLSEPSGSRMTGFAGTESDNTRKMTCDITDLTPGDKVTSEGATYTVEWVSKVAGFTPHLTAGLREVVR